MKQYRIVLGIEVGKDYLRAAEVEHRDGTYFLSRVAEKHVEGDDIDEAVKSLSRLLNDESIMSREASIAIDSSLMARDTIEIDPEMGSDEISRFLRAEIDFHNNFSGETFIPAFEITKTPVEPYKEVFYAAMKKDVLFKLRNMCTRCGLDLQYMDLDHSCSELAINKLTGDAETYILITVKEGQVEASYCQGGERTMYRYIFHSGEPFYFITKLAQHLEMKAKQDADRLFVTGDAADDFLVDLLRKNADERYELLDPAAGLQLSAVASESELLKSRPHHFSHVIGAALK